MSDPIRTVYLPYAGEPRELLDRTCAAAKCRAPVVVIDNSHDLGLHGAPNFVPMTPPVPLTLWQTLWMLVHLNEPFVWVQCDAVLEPGVLDRVLDSADALLEGDRGWGLALTLGDVVSAVNAPALLAQRALPDLNFQHYHGDPDWTRTITRAGLEIVQLDNSGIGHPPGGGGHWKRNPVRDAARLCFDSARYYREKWGGDPGHEKYPTPWNA